VAFPHRVESQDRLAGRPGRFVVTAEQRSVQDLATMPAYAAAPW
jgi:hypothetical protein